MRREPLLGAGLILTLLVLAGVGLWKTAGRGDAGRIAVVSRPQGVMGTSCTLAAIAPARERLRAEGALRAAEAGLRAIEARMSNWLQDSEISHFNEAGAGEEVPLTPETREVLHAAHEAQRLTDGAFDVTCRPLVELWRRAGENGRLPSKSERSKARAASNWELIEIGDSSAVKHAAGACVDLGGIAKGYAIDRALATLQRTGLAGGMVEVGGDLACFGCQANGRDWPVDVKSPFRPGHVAQLRLRDGAVATSGNYTRYARIAGKRYGHIIDPRLGRPADAAQSVTLVAPTALIADVWATALSVLGPEGFRRLPKNVEALMIVGPEDDCQVFCTPGLRNLLREPLPEGLIVWEAKPGQPLSSR